jgi:chromosome segregation ATPase
MEEKTEVIVSTQDLEELSREIQTLKEANLKQNVVINDMVRDLAHANTELTKKSKEVIVLINKISDLNNKIKELQVTFNELYKLGLTATFACAKMRDTAKFLASEEP